MIAFSRTTNQFFWRAGKMTRKAGKVTRELGKLLPETLLRAFFRILPVVENGMNYDLVIFDGIKYGKGESGNNTSPEIGVTGRIHFREIKNIF
jgi:hypothetical protein